MTIAEVFSELEALGTAQNQKIYRRHGVTDEMFGVSYANQEKLARKLKKAGLTDLAVPLWESKNHDAKILATKLLQPEAVTVKLANQLVRGVTHSLHGSGLAAVIAETPGAAKLADQWTAASVSRSHWKVFTGWALIASMAIAKKHHTDVPDEWFSSHLETINRDIQTTANEIRSQMNGTLIAIGSRNQKLRTEAVEVARQIGKVEVDHGETSCKTPDAESYIKKVWDRIESRKRR